MKRLKLFILSSKKNVKKEYKEKGQSLLAREQNWVNIISKVLERTIVD